MKYNQQIPCKVLIYNSKIKDSEWIDGVITGTRAGCINEDFERIDVISNDRYTYLGCHPNCVKEV